MAPVTGGVAYAEKHGLVLAARFLKRRLAPRQPVHRVPGVLPQIRGSFIYQSVAHTAASSFVFLCIITLQPAITQADAHN